MAYLITLAIRKSKDKVFLPSILEYIGTNCAKPDKCINRAHRKPIDNGGYFN